jgi:hypothetical protein
MSKTRLFLFALGITFVLISCSSKQQAPPPSQQPAMTAAAFLGRWDATIKTENEEYPSWFEISREGAQFKGRFVGREGSARLVDRMVISGDQLEFSLPKQYEKRTDDLVFKGKMIDNRIEGTTASDDGKTLSWTAVVVPSLERNAIPGWGESVKLFNGKDLIGWKVRHPERNGWKVTGGTLVNKIPSSDLITEQKFEDFKLHAEVNVPKKGNSGIYLRGRYEVQVEDIYGSGESTDGIHLDNVHMAGIYGFLAPTINAAKKTGEWQAFDITLVGRKVTVVLNGKTVIDNQEIPGITGGALDSNEGTSGPIFLQGDHTGISYRNIVITPTRP